MSEDNKNLILAVDMLIELGESNWKINRKDNIINKLLFDENNLELIDTLTFLSKELDDKGYFLDLSKNDIIKVARKKFQKLGERRRQIWSKDVAFKFGCILKKINRLLVLEKKVVDYNDIFYKGVKILIFGKNFLMPKLNKVISNKINIKLLSVGGNHTIILSQDSNVYTCGWNNFGQLGHGDNESRYNFELVKTLKPNHSTYISCGHSISSVINNGNIYSCGCGDNGRIANLDDGYNNTFQNCNIYNEEKIKFSKVQSGSTHQVALSIDNYLYSCGHNDSNGHNMSFELDMSYFKKISYLDNIKFIQISINCSGYHTLALTASGLVYSWGHNRVGQLGLGHNKFKIYEPSLVKSLSNKTIKFISAGWGHSAVLDINNHLYMCGRNTSGQLSFDKKECLISKLDQIYNPYFTRYANYNVKLVRCGINQTNIITVNDRLFAFGNNIKGKLGCEGDVVKHEIQKSFNIVEDIISNHNFTIIISD